MADTRAPSHRGGPAATGTTPKKGGTVLSQKMGPLPVWGWLLVLVGSYLVYRKLFGGAGAASSASGTTPNYPTGNNIGGGVFLLPGGAGAGGTQPPSNTPGSSPSQNEINALATALTNPGEPASAYPAFYAAQPQATKDFLNSVAQSPAPASLESFFAQNVARQQLGLPYYTSGGLLNPSTGATVPTSPGSVPYWQGGFLPAGWGGTPAPAAA